MPISDEINFENEFKLKINTNWKKTFFFKSVNQERKKDILGY